MTCTFKNSFFLIVFSIVILGNYSCQEGTTNTKPTQSKYSKLHLSLIATEYAIYQKDDKDTQLQLAKTLKLLNENEQLFCPHQNIEINASKAITTDLMASVHTKDQNDELNMLRILKRYIFNLHTTSELDLYLLYLWEFEKQMYTTSKASIDPKLDLFEWNEFVQLTDCLSESWSILDHHFPTPETLGYNVLKFKTQTLAKDDLGKALNQFTTIIYTSNAQSADLAISALNLRIHYIEYIGSIVNDPLLMYSYIH